MRSYDCECGFHADGTDDEALFVVVAAHERERHPEMALTDEAIRRLLARLAYGGGVSVPTMLVPLHGSPADGLAPAWAD